MQAVGAGGFCQCPELCLQLTRHSFSPPSLPCPGPAILPCSASATPPSRLFEFVHWMIPDVDPFCQQLSSFVTLPQWLPRFCCPALLLRPSVQLPLGFLLPLPSHPPSSSLSQLRQLPPLVNQLLELRLDSSHPHRPSCLRCKYSVPPRPLIAPLSLSPSGIAPHLRQLLGELSGWVHTTDTAI